MHLTVRQLQRRFGDTPVLDGLDLDLAPGECVALVGRSGAGKSTLLHLVAGIDRADGGEIRFDDTRLDTLDEAARTRFRRRHLGLVFQSWNLVPSLSALDNLCLPLELIGVGGTEAKRRAQALLDQLGLGALAKRFPDELSGGQQQRVAVARALVHGPSVLLADEPTGSLDAESAAAVMRLLIGACREAGASLLLVTHAAEVMGQADRLLRMQDGRLVPA
ncbi:ABC transporter ATP-binding protein [Aquimonas voraii]|uniref:Putative ABC transport system ATP-binding protein n=1 Tax=Aquimonas voraii TaxID=265719 RepID=A0A1G6XCT6_9GAMM|nr:ABC transporter ATP-binding protein [Aquimonas voraii]SDD75960.1 putative ABC transport system ATP-binding protein [Aquimonas voraii]